MTRIAFGTDTTPSLGDLDANFVELYALADIYKTAGYTPASYWIDVTTARTIQVNGGTSGNAKWGTAASTGNMQLTGTAGAGGTNGFIQLDGVGTTGSDGAQVRLFRNTTQTGTRQLVQYRGDGTATVDHQMLSGNSGTLLSLCINGGTTDLGGPLVLQPSTSAPTLTVNGQVAFRRTSNTEFTIYMRGSDGTTRSGSVTLS